MPGPVFYSANPWFATDVALKYRAGNFFAWICEYFDADHAPAGSAGSLIAPNSNPRKIYEELLYDCNAEEQHSRPIKGHKKTFSRLAKEWLADKEINDDQYAEIIASLRTPSWRIWRPVLYVIPKAGIDPARIKEVRRKERGGYGPEFQIVDLRQGEFDIVDLSGLVRKR
jgi:hypothetical protein